MQTADERTNMSNDSRESTGTAPTFQPSSTPATQSPNPLWLPPASLRRYQWAKGIGSVVFASTFFGWMILQWSSPMMRWAAAILIGLTVWVTLVSLLSDRRRARGRQIHIEAGTLCITSPGRTTRVFLADVADARWRNDTISNTGLWLYDSDGRTMAHLDTPFLADQSEARRFLAWVRQQATLSSVVRWD